jgi:phospholipid-binding lipoprotein MlaA
MFFQRGFGRWIGTCLLLIILSGCAAHTRTTANPNPADDKGISGFERQDLAFLDAYDPFESLNRRIYRFNTVVDNKIIEPIVDLYKGVVPVVVRDRISNFFSNIDDVRVMIHCFLQAKPEKTGKVLGRVMVNSTIGILGLWDPATGEGLIKYYEDFGQTLGVYGVKPGFYLVIPILGPSNLRDATGRMVDSFGQTIIVDQLNIPAATDLTFTVVDGLQLRASLPFSYGDFDSPFEYEVVRTLYLDLRELLVNDGEFTEEQKKRYKRNGEVAP